MKLPCLVLACTTIAALAPPCLAQNTVFTGKVLMNATPFEGATVRVVQGSNELAKGTSDKDGQFRIEVPWDKGNYASIEVTSPQREGVVYRNMALNTVPRQELNVFLVKGFYMDDPNKKPEDNKKPITPSVNPDCQSIECNPRSRCRLFRR